MRSRRRDVDLARSKHGGYRSLSDPGEPSTGFYRISVTDTEGAFLAFLAAGKRVLEIGTGLGVSTNYLAMTAREVVTLDIDPWVHTNVWPNLPENVTPSTIAGVGPYDLVFIDGAHTP